MAMFGGMGSTSGASDQAFRDARFVLDLYELVTDKEAVTSQIKQWLEARNKLEISRAEAVKAEQAVARREKQAAAHEEALAKREEAVAEQEQQVQAMQMRAEQGLAELAALEAEL